MGLKKYAYWIFFLDFVLSFVVWIVFWVIRKRYIELSIDALDVRPALFVKALTISALWVLVYYFTGLYHINFRRSISRYAFSLLKVTLLTVIGIAFVTFLDDPISDTVLLRDMVIWYTMLQFSATLIPRLVLYQLISRWIRSRIFRVRTLVVGSGKTAYKIWQELTEQAPEYDILGYVSMDSSQGGPFFGRLKHFGSVDSLERVLQTRRIEEIVIALDRHDHNQFLYILAQCETKSIKINVVPDLYDYMVGNVKMVNVFGTPLIEIYPRLISPWEAALKRSIDLVVSAIALLLLLPVFAAVALLIRLNSRGPIFYTQERCGKDGVPFRIIKFRSMYVDAEKHGPALSKENDPRITPIGRYLRKFRLDELPQFINVVRGEMSLVGPRPERQYFIDKIVEQAPQYMHLLKVRPGITSMGQIKYGYAENVDQMIERLNYDILYIENMSLVLDFKILFYTLFIVLGAKGK